MSESLPLYPGAVPCIGCSYCCKVRPCPFGEWGEERGCCSYLKEKDDGTYECGIYEEILALPQEQWYFAPAFGAGCCSALNSDRQDLIKKRRNNG
jgi:hypothetical protein